MFLRFKELGKQIRIKMLIVFFTSRRRSLPTTYENLIGRTPLVDIRQNFIYELYIQPEFVDASVTLQHPGSRSSIPFGSLH